MQRHHTLSTALLGSASFVLAIDTAAAQRLEYSVDWRGPTVGVTGSGGSGPLTEGTVLVPTAFTPTFGPSGAPRSAALQPSMGTMPGCVGHPGGTPCHVELDALSHGRDDVFVPGPALPGAIRFSTDEFAVGFPGLPLPPNVVSEGPVADLAPDVQVNLDAIPPSMSGVHGHTTLLDGNGAPSPTGFMRPGLGLVEPRTPSMVPAADGDNLDALELELAPLAAPEAVYFSLDAGFLDPLTGLLGTGSAVANGFVGGDVLVTTGGVTSLYAAAATLGLDLVGGPDSDDLDALILCENHVPGFQSPVQPFVWGPGGGDMLVFSVRRGSAVIGMPDSRFGIPITEGDLLVGPRVGGLSPFPAILFPAESLGLATIRSGICTHNDELDAADHAVGPYFDCDGNGVEDALTLATVPLFDSNGNGILDACETADPVGSSYCHCATGAPCGNVYAAGGCANSTGVGAILAGSGSASIAADNLVLETTQMSAGTFALTFRGSSVTVPVARGDGLACVGGAVYRMPPYATGSGTASIGPGLAALTRAINPTAGWIVAGSTWNFQTWYRTSGGCGGTSSMSNALAVTFLP